MRLASEARNLRLPKLAVRSKKVRNTAQGGIWCPWMLGNIVVVVIIIIIFYYYYYYYDYADIMCVGFYHWHLLHRRLQRPLLKNSSHSKKVSLWSLIWIQVVLSTGWASHISWSKCCLSECVCVCVSGCRSQLLSTVTICATNALQFSKAGYFF